MDMVVEDKKGAMFIISLALVIFLILFLINLVNVKDDYARWAILWLFLVGVFVKLKHRIVMKAIWQKTLQKPAAKTAARARKK